jgi:LuxR family quorum sensing-dependent transcriptional regulator
MTLQLLKTWDFIERMEQAPDLDGIERCLLDLAGLFGLTTIFGGIVPDDDTPRSEIPSRILLQRMPTDWTRRYNEQQYVFRDPILSYLQTARIPFSWDEAPEQCARPDNIRLIHGEASEFGLLGGHVVPVPTLDGTIAAISFGGDYPELDDEARDALTLAANYAVGRLLHVPRKMRDTEVRITPREIDYLLWAPEGKTHLDIATILGISRPTVLKHRSAREKLDATNRTHAVVKATRRYVIR